MHLFTHFLFLSFHEYTLSASLLSSIHASPSLSLRVIFIYPSVSVLHPHAISQCVRHVNISSKEAWLATNSGFLALTYLYIRLIHPPSPGDMVSVYEYLQ